MVKIAVVVVAAFLATVCVLTGVQCLDRNNRDKRQVTYHRDEHHDTDEDDDDHSIQPVTKKPLPTQVVYPGDLSSFYTTETPLSNHPNSTSRQRRSSRRRAEDDRRTKSLRNNKDVMAPQESRLHSSVSIMNDVPVEMSFNGAGFLRHEDEDSSNERKDEVSIKARKSRGGRPAKSNINNDRALDDFRRVFNLSRERVPDQVKFDDEAGYRQDRQQYAKVAQQENIPEKMPEYGTQAEENGSPFAVDFMNAYQNAYQNQFQNPFQSNAFNYMPAQTTDQSSPSYDPFTFNYPNFLSGQQQAGVGSNVNPMQAFNAFQAMNPMSGMQNANQMPSMNQMQSQTQVSQDAGLSQRDYMQNHRMAMMANPAAMNPQIIHQSIPQQAYNSNPAFQNPGPQPPSKPQRRKRSVTSSPNSASDVVTAASEGKDHYSHSPSDQQDSSSGFIPINFNGATLQLNFPFYGQGPVNQPSYSTRPVYSMPIHPEGRQYGGVEGYYHPSEARRFSYGVLGSGNFEVIRGGLFPGEQQRNYNGYQDGRSSYGGNYGNHEGNYGNHGNNDYGNFGTSEIIIDGPIQGFQGFDNFPINLINALSKHSEISVRPNRRDSNLHSV